MKRKAPSFHPRVVINLFNDDGCLSSGSLMNVEEPTSPLETSLFHQMSNVCVNVTC